MAKAFLKQFDTKLFWFVEKTMKFRRKSDILLWFPALYLSVKQIMDESVHSVKKITVAAVFSLLTSFGLNQHGHAVLMYFFSLIYVTNVISKISEIWFSYYLASVLAWSHFWSTLLHSQMFAKKWIPHNNLLRFEWVGSKITKIWFSPIIYVQFNYSDFFCSETLDSQESIL